MLNEKQILELLRSIPYEQLEKIGYHLTENNYYSPIPDSRILHEKEHLWDAESDMVGVDLKVDYQLHLVNEVFPVFKEEYDNIPRIQIGDNNEFFLDNPAFSGTDALALYCMIRHFRPRRIIEVGGGYSTLLSAKAAMTNGQTDFFCIEPYPGEVLQRGVRGLTQLIPQKIEDVDVNFFRQLKDGDILFIDSSHVCRIFGDVNYIYLELLPRLNKGVLVHIHDIFFPREYPKHWLIQNKWFWNEQYLLRAFLAFNNAFEVLLCNSFLGLKHQDALKKTFPNSPWWECGGSFWMRKTN